MKKDNNSGNIACTFKILSAGHVWWRRNIRSTKLDGVDVAPEKITKLTLVSKVKVRFKVKVKTKTIGQGYGGQKGNIRSTRLEGKCCTRNGHDDVETMGSVLGSTKLDGKGCTRLNHKTDSSIQRQ